MNNIGKNLKKDFKILNDNKNLVYLNSAATTLKPDVMVDELSNFYKNNITSINKSFDLSKTTNDELFDSSLQNIASFINASGEELIPTYSTTDALNKIANSLVNDLNDGDEIILGKLEHASNILSWKKAIKDSKKNIIIRWYELDNWKADLNDLKKIVSTKTKVISMTHIFNTTGALNEVEKIRSIVGKRTKIVIDGAQSFGHCEVDVKKIDCDFFVFSAHKALGPLGLGFIYIKKSLMDKTDPFLYGGNMNIDYSEKDIVLANGRKKFISGTQDLPSIVAFSKSIDYLKNIGIKNIEEYLLSLKEYAEKKFISENIKGKIINKDIKSSILFFQINGVAGEDVAFHLSNKDNIFVRSGSSCVKIKNDKYKQTNAVRASFYIYNTFEDIDKLILSLKNGGDFLDALFNKRPTSKICK